MVSNSNHLKEIFSSSNSQVLSNDNILYFYKEILLLCEKEDIEAKFKGCKINDSRITRLKDIKIVYNPNLQDFLEPLQKEGKIDKSFRLSNFKCVIRDVDVEGLDNMIIFVDSSEHKLLSLMKHFRNAFAHNRIVIKDDYIMCVDSPSSNFKDITMIARLTLENFSLLIDAVKIVLGLIVEENKN